MRQLKKLSPLLIVALTLIFMGSTATAFEWTATVETDFDGYLEDAVGPQNWACNEISAYFIAGCTKPIDIEIGGATTSEVKWSVANSGAVATDNREQVLGQVNQNLNSSYGVSIAQAKTEAIQQLNNGSSEANAVSEASDITRGWYAEIQRNVINYRNRHALKFNSSVNEVKETSDLRISDVFKTKVASFSGSNGNTISSTNGSVNNLRVKEFNKTLINGEEIEIYKVQVERIENRTSGFGCSASSDRRWFNMTNEWIVTTYGGEDSEDCNQQFGQKELQQNLQIQNPDNEKIEYRTEGTYRSVLDSVTSTKDRAVSNVKTIVGDIFSQYSQGEVNVSDSLGPLETLKVASTSFNSTGRYDYATVNAEQMGLATNNTYAFTVEWTQEGSNDTHKDNGQLFMTEDAFNGTVEVNKTYDASNQTVWFTRTAEDGTAENVEFTGNFTVTKMIDKSTGESINSTGVQSVEVYDSTIKDIKQQLDSLRQQEERYQSDSGGGPIFGGGDFLSGLNTGMIAVIIGLLLVLGGVWVGN